MMGQSNPRYQCGWLNEDGKPVIADQARKTTEQQRYGTPVTDYDEALSFVDGLDVSAMKLGLDRIRDVLSMLGDPQDQLPVIHVGGTNGKGSVAALLTRVLMAAGYRVGTFTSPHLIDVRERVAIDAQPISREAFHHQVELLRRELHHRGVEPTQWPTYFEFLNTLAFMYFAQEKVDVVILEVGLGGRLDSTNVIKKPLLSIISNIAMDHQEHLGDTLGAIAGEKAGIIKHGSPVVVGPGLPEEALHVLRETADQQGAPWNEADPKRCASAGGVSGNRLNGQIIVDHQRDMRFTVPLLGLYQVDNVATALTAVDELAKQGIDVSRLAIEIGLSQVQWPGRFQYQPEDRLLIDGGHNAQGFQMLGESLREYFPDSPILWMVSMRSNRPLSVMMDVIASFENTQAVYGVAGTNPDLYYAPERICDEFTRRVDRTREMDVQCFSDIEQAMGALRQAQERLPEAIGVVCGSLYTAGEVLRIAQHSGDPR